MITVAEFKRWVSTLYDDHHVATDYSGLSIVELDDELRETGAFLDIGDIPEEVEL